MGANVTDANGQDNPVYEPWYWCESLVGAIIEANHDEKGIIWPEGVTPFHCGLVNLKRATQADAACENIYKNLVKAGLEPLYDDRTEGLEEGLPLWI